MQIPSVIGVCTLINLLCAAFSAIEYYLISRMYRLTRAEAERIEGYCKKIQESNERQEATIKKAFKGLVDQNTSLATQIITACQTRKGHLTVNFMVQPTIASVESIKPVNTLD